MKHIVYCDESRHDGSASYMSIGSLWMDRGEKKRISRLFRKTAFENGLAGEIKWNKVSRLKLSSYKKLIDFFFEEKLNFRSIVVKHSDLDYDKFHGNDKELGFYKFYYELLWHWMLPGGEYLVLLDFKQNKEANRYQELRKVLTSKLCGVAVISDLTVVDSKESPLVQLCDLLTGATAAAWCNDLPLESPKRELIDYISKKRACPLSICSPSSSLSKINIFKIQLQ